MLIFVNVIKEIFYLILHMMCCQVKNQIVIKPLKNKKVVIIYILNTILKV